MSAGVARCQSQQQLIADLKSEIDQWQAKLNAAKQQMQLEDKVAQIMSRSHLARLEQELDRVNAALVQLEESSQSAWKDTYHGLMISLLATRRSFDMAEQYFALADSVR